jgi:hypothetical protein
MTESFRSSRSYINAKVARDSFAHIGGRAPTPHVGVQS